ncbi:hypothetical protein QYM36_000966 [Artemia franciscana]|nr:hypothetical protein QYM36_000966 [Artemia franciscana]
MSVIKILENEHVTKICAPMVRYSKLPFRQLVREFGTDITFTPMIIAEGFVQSEAARDNEFQTDEEDGPLIVQFAAKDPVIFSEASLLVYGKCAGVDINCGCPQRWAMEEGYGSHLIKKPELVAEMVSSAKRRITDPDFTISTKIRLLDDLRETVDLCRQIEAAGADFITVHGRTPKQRSEPVDLEAIKIIKESLNIPVIANGDIYTIDDAERVGEITKVDGVMSARGMLENPAMFFGYAKTPRECVKRYIEIAQLKEPRFMTFHHHLVFMLEKSLPKPKRKVFNNLRNKEAVLEFLSEHYFAQDE